MRVFVSAADSYMGRHIVARLRRLAKEAARGGEAEPAELVVVGTLSGAADLAAPELDEEFKVSRARLPWRRGCEAGGEGGARASARLGRSRSGATAAQRLRSSWRSPAGRPRGVHRASRGRWQMPARRSPAWRFRFAACASGLRR